jgi:hypothetical protein
VISISRLVFSFLLVLGCGIFLAGCADRLPRSTPLQGDERESVIERYRSQLNKDCGKPMDADVSFELKTFGSHQKATGFLQVLPPSFLRVTIVDPVGRPVFILVSAGETFIMVDSVKGQGVAGSIESITKQDGEPLYLQPSEVVSLLQGRLTPQVSSLLDVRREKHTRDRAWLIFALHKDNKHSVLFDPAAGRIERYVVESTSGDIILDVDYTWGDAIKEECPVPLQIKVSGTVFQGEVIMKYDFVSPDAKVPERIFQLTLPEHYTIRYLD